MSDWVELPQLVGKLKIAVERPLAGFDSREVKALVDDLVERTKGTDELTPEGSAEDALQLLRRRRLFADMERLGDALIQSGIEDPRSSSPAPISDCARRPSF